MCKQNHIIVAVIHKGLTLIILQRLEYKSPNHSETYILNDNGYNKRRIGRKANLVVDVMRCESDELRNTCLSASI